MNEREIDKEVNFIQRDKKATELKKYQFIEEIKNGLGDEINNKVNPKTKKKDNLIVRFFKKLFL
tara:strand:+ start:437 stop:628 length:192 start_codon:yes stop_codon:yes gene_type:complete